jgi:hypothetical protein
MPMAYCTQCGTKNLEQAKFCDNCGHSLVGAVTPRPTTTTTRKRGRVLSLLLGVGALIVVCAAGAWFLVGVYHRATEESRSPSPGREAPEPTAAPTPRSAAQAADDVQKRAEEVAGTIFGSDEKVSDLPSAPPPIDGGASDVDRADAYAYKEEDCTRLFTDVVQMAGHSIEGALVEASRISEDEENKLGAQVAQAIAKKFAGKLDRDTDQQAYVEAVGRDLITQVGRKKIAYHFHVITEKEINAFAIPGGGVYVYTGLMARLENEAQLASVLAHEIKHIDLKHCVALYAVLSRLPEAAQNKAAVVAAGMIRHPFDSRREAEADRRGLELGFTRAYSPFQTVRFWENMASRKGDRPGQRADGPLAEIVGRVFEEATNVLSTHPAAAKRACLLRNHIRLLLAKYPRDRFYVGRWNYEHKTPASRRRV